jgi:hypothetical protein
MSNPRSSAPTGSLQALYHTQRRHLHRGRAPANLPDTRSMLYVITSEKIVPNHRSRPGNLADFPTGQRRRGKDNGAERLGTAPTDPCAASADLLRLLYFPRPPPSEMDHSRPNSEMVAYKELRELLGQYCACFRCVMCNSFPFRV